MKKLHALGTGLVGVTLSASAVLAAAPSPSDTTSTIPTSASEDTGKPADNHGAAVSAVATDSTQVGGKHDNHGGAVSEAAHQAPKSNGHAPGQHGGND